MIEGSEPLKRIHDNSGWFPLQVRQKACATDVFADRAGDKSVEVMVSCGHVNNAEPHTPNKASTSVDTSCEQLQRASAKNRRVC